MFVAGYGPSWGSTWLGSAPLMRGQAGRCLAWQGETCHGVSGLGPAPRHLSRRGVAGTGAACHGLAPLGRFGRGTAGRGWAWPVAAGQGSPMAWRGSARHDQARQDSAWLGEKRRGGAGPGKAPLHHGSARLGLTRPGRAGLGAACPGRDRLTWAWQGFPSHVEDGPVEARLGPARRVMARRAEARLGEALL